MEPEYCCYCKSTDLKETEVIGFRDDAGEYRVITEYQCLECGELFYTT